MTAQPHGHHAGIWLIWCNTCGYVGATVWLAKDRANDLADQHNLTTHPLTKDTP